MSRRKKSQNKDPFAKREAEKYKNPVPSREYITLQIEKAEKPLKLFKIAAIFNIDKSDAERFEAIRRRLRAMERDGQLIRNRRGEYGIVAKMDLIRGRIIAHPDGYGFLVSDDEGDDLFLTEHQMTTLMHNDRILANVVGTDHRGRREAAVVDVLERAVKTVVGRFHEKKTIAFVEPSNKRITHNILIPADKRMHAKHGEIVALTITDYPTRHEPALGEITDIIGEYEAEGIETDVTIRSYELPNQWSEEVEAEIAPLQDTVPEGAYTGREDMRDIPFVTIDGEDSRDFDDAVYCEPRGKGWLLKVAIADVSAYVKPDTALDKAAYERGTSVYFPNRVVPMLPEVLSNGLCSLNPQVDRLAIVCEMAIDFYGRTRRIRFFEATIRSAARLTYTQVAKVLAGDQEGFPHPEVIPQIEHLQGLYHLLHKRRLKRGALELETTEAQLLFDDQGKLETIQPVVRNDAHKLIEEMMLAANVATAEWLDKHEMPFLYRIHEGPTTEKLTELRKFLNSLSLRIAGKETPETKHYARLIERTCEREDARLIQTVLLRSLRMAVYTPENKGHFGLAYTHYTHFTSPIRRYPDLLVHRAIRHVLKGKPPEKFHYPASAFTEIGEHCSMTERRAEDASRDVIFWLKCDYLKKHLGEEFDGIISAVTPFGLFVELNGLFIDGLIHISSLENDYYHHEPEKQCLVGKRSGKVYRLFNPVRIKVARVNAEDKKIDFLLAEPK